jgi:large subunit ribosomal protein L18
VYTPNKVKGTAVSVERKYHQKTKRKIARVRSRLKTGHMPRVTVFRSLSHIYAQIIDDNQQKTLASASSILLDKGVGDKKAIAHLVGKELAKKAVAQGIGQVCFDRGRFLFHGRVQALAEGLKEGGLQI